MKSDTPLKVEFDINDYSTYTDDLCIKAPRPYFTKFTITDEKGMRYIFGGINAIEYSFPLMTPSDEYELATTPNSWYLTKIQMPSGEEINFKYERGPYQSKYSLSEVARGTFKRANAPWSTEDINDYVLVDPSGFSAISGSILSPVYLREINYKDINIFFETSKSKELAYSEARYTDVYKFAINGSTEIKYGFMRYDFTHNIPHYERNPAEKQEVKNTQYTSVSNRFRWLKLDQRISGKASIKTTLINSYNK